jgi:hypothetical protein
MDNHFRAALRPARLGVECEWLLRCLSADGGVRLGVIFSIFCGVFFRKKSERGGECFFADLLVFLRGVLGKGGFGGG